MTSIAARADSAGLDDELSALAIAVEEHLPSLTAGNARGLAGQWPTRLVQHDRNLVYRVSAAHTWFVKIPAGGHAEPISRELCGMSFIQRLGREGDLSLQIPCVRGSYEPPYLITAAFAGRSLHRIAQTAAVLRVAATADAALASLGRVVGRLHSVRTDGTVLPTNRAFRSKPDGQRDLRDDSLLREAERDTGFVHGNLYLWNVLAHRSTLGIIDFENAGQGSVYLDLSLVSFQLALLSALPLTSSRTCHRLVRSFWEAYRTIRSFSPDVLHACAGVRAAQQRDWLARSESGTVLGIPLGRKHVRGLVDNALDHHARWCAFERPSHHSSESRWESA